MEIFLKDLKHSLRMFLRSPGFTTAVVAALTLGIGANTAIFSVVNTVLLRPVPYPDPDRLVMFMSTFPGGSYYPASDTKFNVWRQQISVFQDVSAYRFGVVNLTGGSDPEQLQSAQVSADFFRLLGAPVIQGRTFTADEDRPKGRHVAIISYGLWQRRFGGDEQLVGRTISLNGDPYEVIGIIDRAFKIEIEQPPEVWIPLQIDPNSIHQATYFTVVARLKEGLTLGAAKAQLQLAADQFHRKFPDAGGLGKEGFSVQLFRDAIVGDVRSSLLVLVGAVGFVLLIACANVANLLLARATGRKREIAIRAAVGAGRGLILRQLLTESVVLAMVGGALGLILGLIGIRALLAISPGNIPRIGEQGSAVSLDWRVLSFTVIISLTTGILFGLIPAFKASRADLSATLKENSGRSGTGFGQNKARSLLVISEMSLALVLLVGAGLLIRTFIALRSVNPGFETHSVLTMRMSLTGSRFEKTSGVDQLVRDGLRRIASLPGVVAASSSCCLPLDGNFGLPIIVVGRPLKGPSHGFVRWMNISPQYFDVFKIPLLRGRTFTDRDDGGAPPVAIINQAMARQLWPKGDALNDRIIIGKGVGPEFEEPARQIIGIVSDVRDGALNRAPLPTTYVPGAQITDGVNVITARIRPLAWSVRTLVKPYSLSSAIQNELRQASGDLSVGRIRSIEEIVVQSTARADFNMLILTIFGGSALLLAAFGIYGLMAYSIQQRTQEIGIRLALGAEPIHIRNMVILHGMRFALIGVGIGVAAAFGLTRLIASLLFGVKVWDPLVFTVVPIFLIAIALFAVWFPARRASRIDPLDALRHE
jgi:putative ABC transport system permease protein